MRRLRVTTKPDSGTLGMFPQDNSPLDELNGLWRDTTALEKARM